MQDDIKMIKRVLAMNDSKEGKRMSFAIDPTEGKPKDYQDKDDEIEKRTLQLGSPWTSNISNMTRKFGCFTRGHQGHQGHDVEGHDVQRGQDV